MTSVRVYGTPREPIAALAEVERCSGSQFAPEIGEALQRLWTEGRLTLTDVPGAVV
jgi:HD-GYP domain-containing protein (c-di-GMP phosphodiesterase class II)